MAEVIYATMDRKPRQKRNEVIRYNLPRHFPSDLFVPAWYHLLKSLQAPKIEQSAKDLMFNKRALEGHFTSTL